MNIPSDLSFSSFNPESEPPLPETELDDIPEDDEILSFQEQNQLPRIEVEEEEAGLPPSEDIREAVAATRLERSQRLVREGVVIQHTVPKGVSLGYRSDYDFPESPSKRYLSGQLTSETYIDRSSFSEVPFIPSSQTVSILSSSPPRHRAVSPPLARRLEGDMDNPFTFEEEPAGGEGGSPFSFEEVVPNRPNGDSAGAATGGLLGAEKAIEESIYDQAYNNPFSMEENLEDAPTPRLPASTNFSSKPLDKENQDPSGGIEGLPFTLEESPADIPPTTSYRPPIPEPTPTPTPRPNAYTRVKVVSSNGDVFHLLQHPPARLKIYRDSLVNAQHEIESEINPSLPRSQRKYYGVDVYHLKEAIKADAERAKAEAEAASLVPAVQSLAINAITHTTKLEKNGRKLLWTEKYRAKRFTDLLGDERTHRHILRWLKGWDSIVFGSAASKKVEKKGLLSEEQRNRKILLVTGPPGLGKTTMAHVLARQAGYEPLEINASDDRTASVVKNRIRDVVGTETVHMGDAKRGKPVCVIIDEIDGVTGEGEGGFIKALADLIEQDRRNSGDPTAQVTKKKGRKGADKFKFLRPIIAVCNDLYAPSLRTLRPLCEVVYTKRPPLGLVLTRLKDILEKEGIEGDSDAIRRVVELEGGHGNINPQDFLAEWSGDVRGIMVAGEWICGRLRSAAVVPSTAKGIEITNNKKLRMTKKWVEEEFNNGGGLGANDGAGSGGRGNGVREVVEKVFLEDDAGSSTYISSKSGSNQPILPGTSAKSRNMQRLRNLIEASGEFDKIMTDCFAKYPTHPFHDDPTLTKPNKAYEWMFMHDLLTNRVYGGNQDYELTPYLCTPLLGLHTLFATPAATSLKGRKIFGRKNNAAAAAGDDDESANPFTGAKADFEMREAQKANMSLLNQLLSTLPHSLIRGFKPLETIAYELAPWLVQIIQPKVNPVLVGGKDGPGVASVRRDVEKRLVERAVEVLAECNVGFEKFRVEGDMAGRGGGWVFRMEPPFDALSNYKTFTQDAPTLTTRYAVRQVLDQELRKFIILQQERLRQERFAAANPGVDIGLSSLSKKDKDKEKEKERELKRGAGVKRDFFGRVIEEQVDVEGDAARSKKRKVVVGEGSKIWCSFREGFSNAVKKPITWDELMAGL
ncbi:hypothetical protein ABW19_dt0209530 [Dactylella cylindrospora]|nr:hypothetical protein ABW19_dt0209530 [Dactylella cylindrospora]